MKKSKIFGAIAACALAAANIATFAAVPAYADDVDLDGTYHAYIGVQTASYSFRNAYDEPSYGYGVTADDGTVWFDQVTGWEGNDPYTVKATINDAEITGNGTYSVSVTDFDFGDDQSFNLLFVSTDIPVNDTIKFSDVKIKLDGRTRFTFDEGLINEESATYLQLLAINIWNGDLKDYPGYNEEMDGYMMPTQSAEIEFTVSGFNYDKPAAEEEEETTEAETEAATEAETEAAAEPEEETAAASDEDSGDADVTTSEETTQAAAASTTSDADSSSGAPVGLIVGIVAAVIVVAVIVVVVIKKKS